MSNDEMRFRVEAEVHADTSAFEQELLAAVRTATNLPIGSSGHAEKIAVSGGGSSFPDSGVAHAFSALQSARTGGNAPPVPTGQPGRPVEVAFGDQTLRKFGDVFKSGSVNMMMMQAARGDLGGVSRGALSGLMTMAGNNPYTVAGMAAFAATGGAALALNSRAAAMGAQASSLASAQLGGPTSLSGQVNQELVFQAIGANFGYNQGQTDKVTQSLASQGIGSRGNALGKNLSSSLAFSQFSGMDQDKIGNVTASLGAFGKMSPDQIRKAYTDISDAQGKSNVSMGQLVQTLSLLGPTAGGAARNIGQIAGVQGALGSAINAGQILAPLTQSFGTQEIQQAALLGYGSTGAFESARSSNQTDLYNRLGSWARGFGNKTVAAQNIADTMGINLGSQQNSLVDALFSGNTAKAMKLNGGPDILTKGAAAVGKNVDLTTIAVNNANVMINHLSNPLQPGLNDPGGLLKQMGNTWGGLARPQEWGADIKTGLSLVGMKPPVLPDVGAGIGGAARGGLEMVVHFKDATGATLGDVKNTFFPGTMTHAVIKRPS